MFLRKDKKITYDIPKLINKLNKLPMDKYYWSLNKMDGGLVRCYIEKKKKRRWISEYGSSIEEAISLTFEKLKAL